MLHLASCTAENKEEATPHEYVLAGTAKQLTLFHPASGEVRVKGVRSGANAILHPWLKAELIAILATLPEPDVLPMEENRRCWQEDLTIRKRPQELPPLRMLLVWDNLTGHYTVELILWLFDHGIVPLFTPLGGSHLNMAESIQRILKRRALDGQHPKTPEEIIDWLEVTARALMARSHSFEVGRRQWQTTTGVDGA